jgi:DNA-binding transcriptional LysR family regulator
MSGSLDAALVFRSISHFDLNETVLHEGQFQVVVKAKHPILTLPKKQQIAELNNLPAITFKPSVGINYVENHPAFEKLGLVPKHAYFYEDHQSVFQLLEKTNGWAFLPSPMVDINKKITSVFPGRAIEAPVKVCFISSKNRTSSYFIDKLKSELKQITGY